MAAAAVGLEELVQVVGMLLIVSSLAVATLRTVINSLEVGVMKLVLEGRSVVLLIESERFFDVIRV